MIATKHERPGVYSSYDASSAVSAGMGAKTIGVAAKAMKGTVTEPVLLTNYAEAVKTFGEDNASVGMSSMIRLLFANGASKIMAVRVADTATTADYELGFSVLSNLEDIQIVVCDSANTEVQQALRSAVETASANRRERIAVVGGSGESLSDYITMAAAINSERVVLVAPDGLNSKGESLSAVACAAALAGAIASGGDPSLPMNGTELYGLSALGATYGDNEIDTLVRGGVTPLEIVSGTISPVRCVTTRTTTDGAVDATWRELSTIRIVDDVIPSIRNSLRSKFSRSKNTAQNRGAIRSQVIVELEKKKAAQIIDDYGEVTITAIADNPTACLVEFNFAVAHGLNQIYLSAHIAI